MKYQEWLDSLNPGDKWVSVTGGRGSSYFVATYEVVRRTKASIFVRRAGTDAPPTRFNLKGNEVGGRGTLRPPATEEQVVRAYHHNDMYRLRTKLACFDWASIPEGTLKEVANILGVIYDGK